MSIRSIRLAVAIPSTALVLCLAGGAPPRSPREPSDLYVDSERGKDRAQGTRRSPLATISAALSRLLEPLDQSVTIHVAGARHETTGGHGMLADTLELDLRMRPGVAVRIVGEGTGDERVVLDWASSRRPYLITVSDGRWTLENLQLGSGKERQTQGVSTVGPAVLDLVDVRVRTRSLSGAGIHAARGGHVRLRGAIELNEEFHDAVPDGPSFAGIVAEEHAVIRFAGREGCSLSIGNGSLAASYFGCIRLGCETARITSWGGQSNPLAVNNSGRIDLHGTSATLRPMRASNTPIGLEDDGHVLAEGARIVIESVENGSGIVLQKSSALYCTDIEFRGKPKYTLLTYSGSNFAGDITSEVFSVHATTGSTIALGGQAKLTGPFQATRGGTLSLPDGRILRGN